MASSVQNYFPQLVQGAAATLIFQASAVSGTELTQIVQMFVKQFQEQAKFAKFKPSQEAGEVFCFTVEESKEALSISEILNSPLFKNVEPKEPSAYPDQLSLIVARTIKSAKEHFQSTNLTSEDERALINWYSRFMACIIDPMQIANYTEGSEDFMKQRAALGKALVKATNEGGLNESDFDQMVELFEQLMKECDSVNPESPSLIAKCLNQVSQAMKGPNPVNPESLSFTAKYLELVGQSQDPKGSAKDIVGKLKANKGNFFPPKLQDSI